MQISSQVGFASDYIINPADIRLDLYQVKQRFINKTFFYLKKMEKGGRKTNFRNKLSTSTIQTDQLDCNLDD